MWAATPSWLMITNARCVPPPPIRLLPLQTCMPHASRRRVRSNPVQALLNKLRGMGFVVRMTPRAPPRFVEERGATRLYHHTTAKLFDEIGGMRAAVCAAALGAVDEALFAVGKGAVDEAREARALLAVASWLSGAPPVVTLDALTCMSSVTRACVLECGGGWGEDDGADEHQRASKQLLRRLVWVQPRGLHDHRQCPVERRDIPAASREG